MDQLSSGREIVTATDMYHSVIISLVDSIKNLYWVKNIVILMSV